MPDIGYLNGTFMPLAEVRISPDDRGYQFGDGVYEVVTAYRGTPFALAHHLSRLQHSAQAIRLPLPYSLQEWEARILEGVKECQYDHCKVYLQVTRGVAPRDHQFPKNGSPTVLMTFRQMIPLDDEIRQQGVRVMTVPDTRWERCDVKSLNLLPNILAKQQAKDAGAFEAIFVREGIVAEGTASNVMVIRDGTVITPEANHRILAGVTRQMILDIAKKEGVRSVERPVTVQELFEADELFLVGTTIEVLPVIFIDQQSIGQGSPGPLTRQFMVAYKGFIRNLGQA